MGDVNMWDSMEAFLLKECYDLAAQFEKHDMVKDVLRERAKGIDIPKGYVPAQADISFQETEMQILSEAVCGLACEEVAGSEDTVFRYFGKINNLKSSAEKEFVLALLSLRNGTNETQRLNALQHISVALNNSPNDPRYIALASVLHDADR